MLDFENVNMEDPIQINKGFKNIMQKFQGKLDILIMCHGVFKVSQIFKSSPVTFDTTMNVNVRSCLHLISIAIPFLKLTKGNVVAISSVDANIVTKDSFLNTLSKAMINSLIQCSALELAPFGVRVNGVAPGMTYTNFRVDEEFNEQQNKDYLDQFGKLFPLNNTVRYKSHLGYFPY
jgi:NAD(P)-dependent dehydrogenase (short-subunit alcohol dehydrogenase family)